MNKTIIVLIVILLIAGGAFLLKGKLMGPKEVAVVESVSPSPTPTPTPDLSVSASVSLSASPTASPDKSALAVITYTDAGFSPTSITVKAGTTITFKNNSTNLFWPASGVHPTHRAYPGSGIEKCNTPSESTIFDACRGLVTGKSYSFKFDQVGTWKYHDHLHASKFGSITVQ